MKKISELGTDSKLDICLFWRFKNEIDTYCNFFFMISFICIILGFFIAFVPTILVESLPTLSILKNQWLFTITFLMGFIVAIYGGILLGIFILRKQKELKKLHFVFGYEDDRLFNQMFDIKDSDIKDIKKVNRYQFGGKKDGK